MKLVIFFSGFLFSAQVLFAQNIGIGTNHPTEKLHIVGNIKVDTLKTSSLRIGGDPGLGKVLVSDENGNAKWESWQKAMELGSTGIIGRAGSGVGSWCPSGIGCGVSGYQDFLNEVPEGYEFGDILAMDGDYAMASDRYENVGSFIACGVVYVYKFSGVEWQPVQKIIPSKKIAFQYFQVLGISGKLAY